MPMKVPRSLVEFILLGPEDDRRQLQDSPILGDVWVAYAERPGARLSLLITPYKENAAVTVARALSKYRETFDSADPEHGAHIAYLQGIVAASLTFEEVLRFVVPMTSWWRDRRIATAMQEYIDHPGKMEAEMVETIDDARRWLLNQRMSSMQDLTTRRRYAALSGLILWAQGQPDDPEAAKLSAKEQAARILERIDAPSVSAGLRRVFAAMEAKSERPLVWTVSRNREATPALGRSVPAVKADAARTLFTVDCSEIVWAIIDSGIDARHYAFFDRTGKQTRIKRSFDFTKIRDIVTLDNAGEKNPRRITRAEKLLATSRLKTAISKDDVADRLKALANGAEEGRPINWELVEELVEIDPNSRTPSNHGTHVAGIIAADRKGAVAAALESQKTGGELPPGLLDEKGGDWADGMCPDISLYDLRVLAPTLEETEFAIIAALQYIRYINERNSYMTIHGANLSLSIPHDVRNFACGRTPICNECERLVNSGVVVVAAAGNRGYQNYETREGLVENYAAFSVTDPGNADGVITVGATHRYWPHTYGVSFFSSRGPTGDGRLKPDLVAPGERIRGPLPDNQWGDLDGTSMAAPHVSGAAAMLMARYSELVGHPRRIKDLLCGSATDLGRERSFQGHGMLDVLRAFQTI
jgi:serine protease AprX